MEIKNNQVILGKKWIYAESPENPIRTISLDYISSFMYQLHIYEDLRQLQSAIQESRRHMDSHSVEVNKSDILKELKYIESMVEKMKESLRPYLG
jgi:hypothetical protein